MEKEGSLVATSICTRCLHKVSLVGWDDNTSTWHHDATGLFTCPDAPTVLADVESMKIGPEVRKVLEPWLLVDVTDANALDYLTAMDRHHEQERERTRLRDEKTYPHIQRLSPEEAGFKLSLEEES